MKEMNNFIYKILFFILISFSVNAENKTLSIGSVDANVTIKVFSSLTCPHCANFHINIFENLILSRGDITLLVTQHIYKYRLLMLS